MSMELNKVFAAILLGGLIAMMTGFIAELLVSPQHVEQNAYVIDTSAIAPKEPAAGEQPAGPAPIAPLLASASADEGQKVSKACQSCHTFEQGGANKVGPNLHGIVGAPPAHAQGFGYSDAIRNLSGPWDYEALNKFIYDPKGFAPGTKMTYAGLKNDKDRANLIAYLRSVSPNAPPVPEAAAAPAAPQVEQVRQPEGRAPAEAPASEGLNNPTAAGAVAAPSAAPAQPNNAPEEQGEKPSTTPQPSAQEEQPAAAEEAPVEQPGDATVPKPSQ